MTPGDALEFQGETSLLLRADGNVGISFPMKQGNQSSSRLEERENTALLELWHENSGFLSSGDRYLGDLPELHQGCQVPFRISRGKVGFLSRHCSGKEPRLALREESHGCSRVVVGSVGFLSSCNGDLRDPLVLPMRSQVSFQVVRVPLGFLSSRCW